MNSTVRYFRVNFVEARFGAFLVTIVVLCMRVALFLHNKGLPEYPIHDTGFVWQYIAPFFQTPTFSFVFSTIFVYLIALFISQLNLRFGIIRTRTHLPFSAPLILFSLHPFFLHMSPDFVALFFILLAFFPLLESHQRSYLQKYAYQSGILLAIASIFTIYVLFFIPLWWRGAAMMSRFSIKAVLSSIFGTLLVYWIVFALYVFADNIVGFTKPFYFFALFDIQQLPTLSVPMWGFLVSSSLFVIGFIIADYRYFSRDKVVSQKMFLFITLLIVCSILLQILYRQQSLLWIYLIVMFLAFIMAHFYTFATLKWDIYSFFLIAGLAILMYSMNYFSDFLAF